MKKILCISGDYWHPAEVPERGLAFLAELGYELELTRDASGLNADCLRSVDAVILARGDSADGGAHAPWYTEENVTALCDFVRSGGGLLAVHAGLTCDDGRIRKLVGCRFLYHPEQCSITTAALCPHPITKDVGRFTVRDEHYVVEILSDVQPLFASASESELNAGGYVHTYGDGRVCTLMPGHNPEVWANTDFRRALLQSVRWVCGE